MAGVRKKYHPDKCKEEVQIYAKQSLLKAKLRMTSCRRSYRNGRGGKSDNRNGSSRSNSSRSNSSSSSGGVDDRERQRKKPSEATEDGDGGAEGGSDDPRIE